MEEIVNIEFKEYFKQNRADIMGLPSEVQQILIKKARIRPYQKSVARFREIMISPVLSPIDKLIALQSLKSQIQADINEFWEDLITDKTKITLNRDELTSIMLFIISRAEVEDLMSQVRLMTEFISQDIQEAS